jgi:hypothetical protein
MTKDLEDDIQARSIYDHTCGILFFATPHRGIVMDDVIAALNKKSDKERIRLLESLNPALKLSIELERFINISPRIKISSFYETAKTNAIVLVCPLVTPTIWIKIFNMK